MSGLLTALGQKLADRWFALLVLPGALYLAAVAAADVLGQAHALDLAALPRKITAWAKTPTAGTAGGQVTLLAAVLVGAAVAGLVANALGRVIEHAALAADWYAWPSQVRRVAERRIAARLANWESADARYQQSRKEARRARELGDHSDPANRERAYSDLLRIAELRPERPTWSGDRIHAVARRLRDDLDLDLARNWPTMWLTLPETARTELTAARTALSGAANLGGWAALCLPLTIMWWPAALIALALAAAARSRLRAAAETYAQLLEASARLGASGK